jgi:hypothetical protein
MEPTAVNNELNLPHVCSTCREISGSEISIDGVQTAAPDVIQQ